MQCGVCIACDRARSRAWTREISRQLERVQAHSAVFSFFPSVYSALSLIFRPQFTQVAVKVAREGSLLVFPTEPAAVGLVAQRCLSFEPSARPTFHEIVESLQVAAGPTSAMPIDVSCCLVSLLWFVFFFEPFSDSILPSLLLLLTCLYPLPLPPPSFHPPALAFNVSSAGAPGEPDTGKLPGRRCSCVRQ